MPGGSRRPGWVAHTLGWPLDSSMYGGGWIYGLRDNRVSLGLVVGLEYHNPRFRSARGVSEIQDASVRAPHSRRRQAGALRRKDGADGRLVFHAAHLCRRRADHRRFRGLSEFAAPQGHSHGDQDRHAGRRDDFRGAARRRHVRSKRLAAFPRKVEASWAAKELRGVRNFHQAFQHGLWRAWRMRPCSSSPAGRGLVDPMRAPAGYQEYQQLDGAGPAPPRFQGRRQADV